MLGGSPGGRRRRLINGVVGTISGGANAAENYYTAVPSSSSSRGISMRKRRDKSTSRDVRKQSRGVSSSSAAASPSTATPTPMEFHPVDPSADHRYRIAVARDGSMITAIPIRDNDGQQSQYDYHPINQQHQQQTRSQPRASPMMYSDLRAFSINGGSAATRDSPTSIGGKSTWSKQSLLEARGKQRSKMKSTRPSKANDKVNGTTSNSPPQSVKARNKLKSALPFAGSNKQQGAKGVPSTQPNQLQQRASAITIANNSGDPRLFKVRWDLSEEVNGLPQSQSKQRDDESFSSFPILSPTHKFEEADGAEKVHSNSSNDTKVQTAAITPTTPPAKLTSSFETMLHQRMVEIQTQQKELAQSITKKKLIERTLITAIDENLERNRLKFNALDDELKVIQWHLKLNEEKEKGSVDKAIVPTEKTAYNANDSESVGDPSIAFMDSVAEIESVSAGQGSGVMVTRLDPPARPSPPRGDGSEGAPHPSYHREKHDPDGPRISAVLRGKTDLGRIKKAVATGSVKEDGSSGSRERSIQQSAKPMKPQPIRPLPAKQPPLHHNSPRHQQLQQNQHPRQNNTINPQLSRRRSSSFLPHQKGVKKNVHFNLPSDTASTEIKIVRDSPSDDAYSFDNQGTVDFDRSPPRKSPLQSSQLIQTANADEDSWQGEHYNVDTYDEQTGNIISAEHYDAYQWRDKEHHLVTTEHYSNENHHHVQHRQPASPFSNHNNRGVSSGSVETDPDLNFMHSVAAVVIQTAVRRFLAEVAAVERLYAVQVIQTVICSWMARKTNPHFTTKHGYCDDRYDPVIPYNNSCNEPQQSRRVMFEDEYTQSYHFAATELQRCYRGWHAREYIQVDQYAASTIQRAFRGWWAREALEVDRYCAVEIQRVIRGYLCRMSYIYDLYCIIVAQSVARRYIAFYTSAVRLANVLYIQAIYRGYRVRSELARYVRNGQEVAATLIQAQWRSYDSQMNFVNTLADILIVQSVARRWLTIRRAKKLKQRATSSSRYSKQSYPATIQKNAIQKNSSVSRAINNLKKTTASQIGYNQTSKTAAPLWQQHKLKPVAQAEYPTRKTVQYPEEFDAFSENSAKDEWYDGNRSETSDMLKNWKGRSSK